MKGNIVELYEANLGCYNDLISVWPYWFQAPRPQFYKSAKKCNMPSMSFQLVTRATAERYITMDPQNSNRLIYGMLPVNHNSVLVNHKYVSINMDYKSNQ